MDILSFETIYSLKRISSASQAHHNGDVFELILILVRDHRTPDGEPEMLDVNILLQDNDICRQKFMQWLQQTACEEVTNMP